MVRIESVHYRTDPDRTGQARVLTRDGSLVVGHVDDDGEFTAMSGASMTPEELQDLGTLCDRYAHEVRRDVHAKA